MRGREIWLSTEAIGWKVVEGAGRALEALQGRVEVLADQLAVLDSTDDELPQPAQRWPRGDRWGTHDAGE